MPEEDVTKLKARLKSLSRRAPVFKSEDEELDINDIFGKQAEEKQKDYW
jgi:G3E family GTPase